MKIPDFGSVLTELRLLYNKNTPPADGSHSPAAQAIGEAFRSIEKEAAVQAIEILFGHLMQFEQARDAIMLMAYAVPHDVRSDPRIRKLMKEARDLGEKMRTPTVERAQNYIDLIHAIEDDLMKMKEFLPQRGLYWLSVTELGRAETSMEFGTGCGSNVFHCAQLDPNKEWIGVDVSPDQIKFLKEQAIRLAIPNVSFYTMAEAAEKGVKADVVALLDVLEHSVWGDDLLDAAEKLVAPSGVVCITVPNGPWSPWSLNRTGTVPGCHVAVESLPTLCARVEHRGELLDARLLPGSPSEGNSNAACAYVPRQETSDAKT